MHYKVSYFNKDKSASPFIQFKEFPTMDESVDFVKSISSDHVVLEIKYYLDDDVKKPDRT